VLRSSSFHFGTREVLVAIVYGLELAAINGDACTRQKTYLTAELDEACAYFVDGRPVVLAEIGNRL
jgi:hypothetical protein